MAMSPEVEAEYNSVLREAVLHHGCVVSNDPSIYDWASYYGTKHARSCTMVSENLPIEITWEEFDSTDAGDLKVIHGISLQRVRCECGKLKNREMRWETNPSEMIKAVFEIMYSRR